MCPLLFYYRYATFCTQYSLTLNKMLKTFFMISSILYNSKTNVVIKQRKLFSAVDLPKSNISYCLKPPRQTQSACKANAPHKEYFFEVSNEN